MASTETSPGVAVDQLTRALGEAVIRIWSDLPQEVQDHLFKGAVRRAANRSDRNWRSSCMTSMRARWTRWAIRAT